MKKKKIEAIPWILPGKKRYPRSILFAVAADVIEIDGEYYLIVDFWQKGKWKLPVLRAAYADKDWALQYPQEGRWTREGIKRDYLGKDTKAEAMIKGQLTRSKRTNTDIDQESAEKIFRYVEDKSVKDRPWRDWIDELRLHEDNITEARRRKSLERRMEALRQRDADMPDIPKAFEEWAAGQLADTNFLYYRKKGRKVTVRCSRCGEEYGGYTWHTEAYESQFEHVISDVARMKWGTCECCGTRGMYRPIGRMKGTYGLEARVYLVQPYHEKDFVLRYFEQNKYLRTDCAEEYELCEIARVFVTREKIQIDYHKAGMCGAFWDDCNLAGMSNIEIKAGKIWPGSWPLVKNTRCTHTGLCEYAAGQRELKPARYLGEWKDKPYLEVLSKNGLYRTVEDILNGGWSTTIFSNIARRPAEILGVYPYRMKRIREENGDTKLIRVLQLERKMHCHFDDRQIGIMKDLDLTRNRGTRVALQVMGVQKLINRIYKYAGLKKGEEYCSHAAERLRQTANRYLDYLAMRNQMQDDLTDSIIQYPRDLDAAHDEMVLMTNERKEEIHIRQKEEQYPEIRKQYRSLRRKYYWEDEAYVIRPARSAEEIILEGRELHHCVGGDTYLSGHNAGESIILLLRLKETPQVPYVTVEIVPGGETIRQWYGIRDTKPDRRIIDRWLEDYLKMLREYGSMDAAAVTVETPVMERLLVPAV